MKPVYNSGDSVIRKPASALFTRRVARDYLARNHAHPDQMADYGAHLGRLACPASRGHLAG